MRNCEQYIVLGLLRSPISAISLTQTLKICQIDLLNHLLVPYTVSKLHHGFYFMYCMQCTVPVVCNGRGVHCMTPRTHMTRSGTVQKVVSFKNLQKNNILKKYADLSKLVCNSVLFLRNRPQILHVDKFGECFSFSFACTNLLNTVLCKRL